jgi:prophage DNA circulation protein
VAATNDPAALIRRIALCTLALCALAKTTANYQPASSTDAANVLAEVVPLFDAEIEYAADANDVGTYQAMSQLRQAISDDLPTRGSNLPTLIAVTVPPLLPACRLSHLLCTDGNRIDELIQRIHWVHPMFCDSSKQALSF